MEELRFNFRDVFRSARYAFSAKKIANHFFGLAAAYLIHEVLVYLSLTTAGIDQVSTFWKQYGLRPVSPLAMGDWPVLTQVAIGISPLVLFVCFFVSSAMVSKITLEQLKGNPFYSIGDAKTFIAKRWVSVFGTLIGFVLIFILLMLVPVTVGLLGKIPVVGQFITMLTAILLPLAFIVGLLALYQILSLFISLFFAPSVVAVADSDSFETIYQIYSMIWNRPWRIVIYEELLLLTKLISTSIWAIFCLIGTTLVLLPIRLLIPADMAQIMGQADVLTGGLVSKISDLGLFSSWEYVFETTDLESMPLKIAGFFMALTILAIFGLVLAYLLSIASVGNTIIYTVLRYQINGENVLEEEDIAPMETTDADLSDEKISDQTDANQTDMDQAGSGQDETGQSETASADQSANTED